MSDSVTPWSIARQVPLFMEFSRQEFLSGLPFPFPGDVSNPGIEPSFPTWQADSLPSEPPGKPPNIYYGYINWISLNLTEWGEHILLELTFVLHLKEPNILAVVGIDMFYFVFWK